MNLRTIPRFGSLIIALLLGVALLAPGSRVAAQGDPTTEQPAAPTSSPSPGLDTMHPVSPLLLPGPPPTVGTVIVEDALTARGLLPGATSCPSGKNSSDFVGEGYIIKITGRCRPESTQAAMNLLPISGLEIPDGEIRIEAKVVSGGDRTAIWIIFRGQSEPWQEYLLGLTPGRGVANLYKNGFGVTDPIVGRADLAGQFAPNDWNDYAIRLQGPDLWVLLNGAPILSAADTARDNGWMTLGVKRLGEVNDEQESAVVFRNLRISRLAPKP